MQQLFADGLGGLTVIGGVVRIELVTQGRVQSKAGDQSSAERQQSQTALYPAYTINMPVEGFANLVSHFQKLVGKLESDGMLKRQDKERTPTSPNFN